MSRIQTTRAGFTLIELMIAVAIMGVLASTAIGLFRIQQLRSKRTEAMTNLEAIAKMERGYYGENGIYPPAAPVPATGIPGQKTNWDAASSLAFGNIGFAIEGSVYFIYDVNSAAPPGLCACPTGGCFTVGAYGDSDLDGGTAMIGYFHADDGGTACPLQVFAAVGPPIDPVDGLPILDQPVDIHTYSGPVADDY